MKEFWTNPREGFMARLFWIAVPALPLTATTCFLEIFVRMGFIPAYLLPSPSSVIGSLIHDRHELFEGFLRTLCAASLGLILSVLFGLTCAVGLSVSTTARRAFMPYAIFFQTVPIIALAPVLVIWFGFGIPTVVASAFIVSLFPIIANSVLGLRSVDADLESLFRLYRSSRWNTLIRLRLPSALPQILAGLRISSGLAVIGAVVGEFIAGGGLGEVIDAARTQQRLDKVFAAVLLSSALGLIFILLIDRVARYFLAPWHRSEQKV